MYDCHWELVQTWALAREVMEQNFLDDSFMIFLKEVFNMGYHYYYEDGSIYFTDPTGYEYYGTLYPDGYGFMNGYDFEDEASVYSEFYCHGAQGYFEVSKYNETVYHYTPVIHQDWYNDCHDYEGWTGIDHFSSYSTGATEEYSTTDYQYNSRLETTIEIENTQGIFQ